MKPLEQVLPEATRRIAAGLSTFVVEHPKTARAFLKQVGTTLPIQQLTLLELNEHTKPAELKALLAPLLAGQDVGLISEAGCPAVADPGADLVQLAHRHGIKVKPLTGPSSILLALMGSGLVGQRLAFHGYLPAKPEERSKALKDLEKRAERDDAAQAFIETPSRNTAMLESILAACHNDLLVTTGIAKDPFLVPGLVGQEFSQVRALVESRGFRIGRVTRRPAHGVFPRTVLEQYPARGSWIRPGDALDLVVADSD